MVCDCLCQVCVGDWVSKKTRKHAIDLKGIFVPMSGDDDFSLVVRKERPRRESGDRCRELEGNR